VATEQNGFIILLNVGQCMNSGIAVLLVVSITSPYCGHVFVFCSYVACMLLHQYIVWRPNSFRHVGVWLSSLYNFWKDYLWLL